MTILATCRLYSTFKLSLEEGPWDDFGVGHDIEIVSQKLENDGQEFNPPEEAMTIIESSAATAQLFANEKRLKIVLAISGNHKSSGRTRQVLGEFHPQTKTEFMTPCSSFLVFKPDGQIEVAGETEAIAREKLMGVVARFTTKYHVWEKGRKTKNLIPHAPNGYRLQVLIFPNKVGLREWGEHFLAIPNGSNLTSTENPLEIDGNFVIAKGIHESSVVIPGGSLIHNGDCWQVITDQADWHITKSHDPSF